MAQKVNLFEIEVGYRIDTGAWTADAPAYWISHSAEGEPSVVEEDGIRMSEEVNLAACKANPSSWFWDSGNDRLYVHTTGSDSPANYIILSFFWEYYTNKQFDGSEEIVFNGNYYLPYIGDSIPDITQKVTNFLTGSYVMDFGTLTLINADGRFDSRFTAYVYEACRAIFKVGLLGAAYVNYSTFWRGWTGQLDWNDDEVKIATEDLRKNIGG